MSVQDQIDRLTQNVADTYSVLEAAGAAMPAAQTSDNLAATAASINAVLYAAQSKSAEEKEQARANIGAVGSVNGKAGEAVSLSAADVGAMPANKVLTAGVSYYVDAQNGSDSNAGTSVSAPFATVQKAINSLPSDLGGNTVMIYLCSDIALADGQKIRIEYKGNGTIRFQGYQNTVRVIEGKTTGYDIGIVSAKYCDLSIKLYYVHIKQHGDGPGVAVNESSGQLFFCYGALTGAFSEGVTGSASSCGIFLPAIMFAVIVASTISNWSNSGVRFAGGFVSCQGANSFSSNKVGVCADAGIIIGEFSLSGNTTNYSLLRGGRIYTGAQASVPSY